MPYSSNTTPSKPIPLNRSGFSAPYSDIFDPPGKFTDSSDSLHTTPGNLVYFFNIPQATLLPFYKSALYRRISCRVSSTHCISDNSMPQLFFRRVDAPQAPSSACQFREMGLPNFAACINLRVFQS